jgi:transposase
VSANENGNAPETLPRFEAINRQQLVLRPVDIEELIEPHHPARNIWEFLGQLDLSPFAAELKSVEGHAGRSAWEPRLLISMWLYAYSRGISSAREIERQSQYEPGLQWLTGLQVVNHHTLSDFRVQRKRLRNPS